MHLSFCHMRVAQWVLSLLVFGWEHIIANGSYGSSKPGTGQVRVGSQSLATSSPPSSVHTDRAHRELLLSFPMPQSACTETPIPPIGSSSHTPWHDTLSYLVHSRYDARQGSKWTPRTANRQEHHIRIRFGPSTSRTHIGSSTSGSTVSPRIDPRFITIISSLQFY